MDWILKLFGYRKCGSCKRLTKNRFICDKCWLLSRKKNGYGFIKMMEVASKERKEKEKRLLANSRA